MKETLSDDILTKMHAAPKADHPIMDPHDLPNHAGLMFGFPTRWVPIPQSLPSAALPLSKEQAMKLYQLLMSSLIAAIACCMSARRSIQLHQ